MSFFELVMCGIGVMTIATVQLFLQDNAMRRKQAILCCVVALYHAGYVYFGRHASCSWLSCSCSYCHWRGVGEAVVTNVSALLNMCLFQPARMEYAVILQHGVAF